MKLINQFWVFFASVQLAIFTLCSIAVTSIIGTLIPQGESQAFYVEKFSAKAAMFFQILDIPTMYSSWWFYGLLALLSINLIICSLDRFPAVWRIICADNLAVSPERIEKMSSFIRWSMPGKRAQEIDWPALLTTHGWHGKTKEMGKDALFFCQKGRWSRVGVYIVHMSILVIFIGAIVGHFFGFKGSVMIPELRSTDKIFTNPGSKPIELGFTLRCDSFGLEFYNNGMPKEYKSSLTILENGMEVMQKEIRVNTPLSYRGITFYQSSYQGHQEFVVQIIEMDSGERRQFSLPFQQQISWDEKNLHFGIINAEASGQRAIRSKVWFKPGNNEAITQWVDNNETVSITSGDQIYSITVKQLYSTGLQVAKDPGVWIVYLGCGFLLFGLYIAFFLSHKRIWLYQHVDASSMILCLAGSANKNKPAFAKEFARLADLFDQTTRHHDGETR
jgi:cytochrome c biogenesis protein